MVTSKEFVESSISHQLGRHAGVELSYAPEAFERAIAASSGMTLSWDHAAIAPKDLNGWQPSKDLAKPWQAELDRRANAYKTTDALHSILEAGADFDFLIDMQDHRNREVADAQGRAAPLFNFNRLHERPTGQVLWPLPHYHDIDSPEFLGHLDPSLVAWGGKSDRVVWRGGPGNRGRLGPRNRGEMIRMHPLLRKYKSGEFSRDETLHVLKSMQRFRFLHRYSDDPRFDLGYTNSDGFVLEEEPFLADFERPRIPREDFQTYKYIVVLPGNDVGSSLYWSLNSGSVAMVVDCQFETFATHHFKPWEHFVPIRKNHGNVGKRLAWCDDHQDECQAMVARAAEMCKFLADPDLRQSIAVGVVDGVRSGLGLPKAKPASKVKKAAGAKQTAKKTAAVRKLATPARKTAAKKPRLPRKHKTSNG
ncbi:glycosyl transferase family 90 [Sulfitobacter sp.]|uniref:glycosyl transferase family 90 n=1 Tax=Sulfitobacter sp. TaxID=1903071 RepID=UPI003F6CFABC